jgi:hypothetical protein
VQQGLSLEIVDANRGVSIVALQRLLPYFCELDGDTKSLIPIPPEDEDSVKRYDLPQLHRRLLRSYFKLQCRLFSSLDSMRHPLLWCDLSQRLQKSLHFEPINPLEGLTIDLIFAFPKAEPIDDLCLEQVDYHYSKRVIISIADTADRWFQNSLDRPIEQVVQPTAHDLFLSLPPQFDLAVMDRFACYLSGWEMPKKSSSYLKNHFGLITDYLAEAFHYQLKHTDRYEDVRGGRRITDQLLRWIA